jgi:hypothetical protein
MIIANAAAANSPKPTSVTNREFLIRRLALRMRCI